MFNDIKHFARDKYCDLQIFAEKYNPEIRVIEGLIIAPGIAIGSGLLASHLPEHPNDLGEIVRACIATGGILVGIIRMCYSVADISEYIEDGETPVSRLYKKKKQRGDSITKQCSRLQQPFSRETLAKERGKTDRSGCESRSPHFEVRK